jgi:hypothetical protein
MSAVPQIGADACFTRLLAKPFDLEGVLRCVDETLWLA